MCGISAIVKCDASRALSAMKSMVERLHHRGPDASGITMSEGCVLGHARLSIIDLDSGSQPMQSADGRYSITYNGEIYNYQSLKHELEAQGRQFHTASDTEVILVAFDTWGSACVDRFRGMFAFAIWDSSERRLFVARDLFGEKPLYYASTSKGTLVLSSEIKGILASGLIEPKLEPASIDAYLAFGYVPPDRTVYANIHTLPGGHYLAWHDGKIETVRYWQPHFEKNSIDLPEASRHLRMLIERAVERQMVSDVPVGAFLSGGLDSSTIVALMQQHSTRPVKTFSVGFGEWINELPYARAVAECYSTEHHEIDLGTPDVAGLLEKMAGVYDEPFADTSNIPTFLISEFAHQQVKVVLTGDGGDELFGGYAWHPPLVKSETAPSSYFSWIVLRMLSKALRDSNADLRTLSVAAGMAARWNDPWERCMMSGIQFRTHERTALWGPRVKEAGAFVPGIIRPSGSVTGIDRGFYHDLVNYLPGDILVKVDRAAMANSLETRAPFLDRDVAEFALSLPATLKVRGNETKVVLREACIDLWPESLRSRRKQGFGAPTASWLDLPGVPALLQRVCKPGSALKSLLPGISERHLQSRDYKTWILLTLGLWLERHKVEI